MKSVFSIFKVWGKVTHLFNKTETRKYHFIILLSFFGAVLELLGISVLLHTVLSILHPGFIDHNTSTSLLKSTFNIENDRDFILLLAVLLLAVYITKNAFLIFINKMQIRIAFAISDGVSERFFNTIANKELLYFKNRKSVDIINSLLVTSVSFPESVILPSILLWSEYAVILLLLAAIFWYNPVLCLFTILVMLPAAFILIRYNRKQLARDGKAFNAVQPKLYETINEMIRGVANIKLWNGLSYFEKRYKKYKKQSHMIKERLYVNSQFVPLRLYEVIGISGILCIVLFGILRGYSIQTLVSFISIYAGVSFRLLPSINRVIGTSNIITSNEYILDFFYSENQATESLSSKKEVTFNEHIKLKDVSFSYEDKLVFENVNLTIEKGDTIGITGKSGDGKSTLLNVLSSLLSPTSGMIYIDNQKLSSEHIASYRFLFSYVKQNVFMLDASILKNVAFLEAQVDMERVEECLKMVNLSDWVQELSEGLETRVGELGEKISGGQRQRIAIARALYKKSDIFIFDEATNNLDAKSKAQTIDAICALKESGKTVILITHNEEELSICNHVYRLENNRLDKQTT